MGDIEDAINIIEKENTTMDVNEADMKDSDEEQMFINKSINVSPQDRRNRSFTV
jgi:mannose/fructose/N-acetylgalactosamine-specific phosphotransferase system component IIB